MTRISEEQGPPKILISSASTNRALRSRAAPSSAAINQVRVWSLKLITMHERRNAKETPGGFDLRQDHRVLTNSDGSGECVPEPSVDCDTTIADAEAHASFVHLAAWRSPGTAMRRW